MRGYHANLQSIQNITAMDSGHGDDVSGFVSGLRQRPGERNLRCLPHRQRGPEKKSRHRDRHLTMPDEGGEPCPVSKLYRIRLPLLPQNP